MKTRYLFLMLNIVSIIGSIGSIISYDYRPLIPLLFFSIMGMIAFIQTREEENRDCGCKTFWSDIDNQCFRCGGKKRIGQPNNFSITEESLGDAKND